MASDLGYSPLKTGIIWAGGVGIAVIVAIAIVLGVRVESEKDVAKYEACFQSGQSAAECSVALK